MKTSSLTTPGAMTVYSYILPNLVTGRENNDRTVQSNFSYTYFHTLELRKIKPEKMTTVCNTG